MRLKTYTAKTMAEAMQRVRQEMGEEAIIVSTQKVSDGGGSRVTAALEDGVRDNEVVFEPDPEEVDVLETIRHALSFHGTPPRLIDRLVLAADNRNADDPVMTLAGALDSLFSFSPLPEQGHNRPLMLIGPPGVGKTVTVAKLATRAKMGGIRATVITTDTQRAGAVEQLEAFTRILDLDLKVAGSLEQLGDDTAAAKGQGLVLIDTSGTNPFDDDEMETLSSQVKAANAEPVLILAAGGDSMEAADISVAFAGLGPQRLLPTQLDMVRRLGSILAAADAAHLRFCDVSITPHVTDGLSSINPVSLARLIIPHAPGTQSLPPITEAAS